MRNEKTGKRKLTQDITETKLNFAEIRHLILAKLACPRDASRLNFAAARSTVLGKHSHILVHLRISLQS